MKSPTFTIVPMCACMLVIGNAWAETSASYLDKESVGLRLTLDTTLTVPKPASPPLSSVAHPTSGLSEGRDSPHTESRTSFSASPPGVNASQQQYLLSHAEYWESRGRSDLATKFRSRINSPALQTTVLTPTPTLTSKQMAETPMAVPRSRGDFYLGSTTSDNRDSPQNKSKQVQYWAERGRTDLVGKEKFLSSQPSIRVIPTKPEF